MRGIVFANKKGARIEREIYGHFAEHLGRCIYGGLYVGKNSAIPNVNGMRKDVVGALKAVEIPVLRWPGGCFADEYHWKDGIGHARKRMVNNNWGGVVEDNSFGTHEFLELCEQIGCEPYINMNVGSGTVHEMQEWIEYITMDDVSPMADMRRQNGRESSWRLKYLGVGNESWGCGGDMRPEYYADVFRRYQTYARNYGANKLYKIACGAGAGIPNPGYEWTETLMREAGRYMDGLSLHYYTVLNDESGHNRSSATSFSTQDYYELLCHAKFTDKLLCGHEAIMDRYDPERRIGLIFDEWGTWYNVEPGTNPGFLYQQNTMRDALVAAMSLNIFNRHAARVRMANLAQLANVLQAMVLTEGEQMLLTPTYHVFELYKAHQSATLLHTVTDDETIDVCGDQLAKVDLSASCKDGKITVTLAHTNAEYAEPYALRIEGTRCASVSGRILTGDIHAMNTFDAPNTVGIQPYEIDGVLEDLHGSEIAMTLPPCSVVELSISAD